MVTKSSQPRSLAVGIAVGALVLGAASFAMGRATAPNDPSAAASERSSVPDAAERPVVPKDPEEPASTTTQPVPARPATTVPVAAPSPTRNVYPLAPGSESQYAATHHSYPAVDIFAACGTPVVAPVAGRIDELSGTDNWDPVVDDGATRGGLSVSIVGDDGVRYYGSHLRMIAPSLRAGARVTPGQTLGEVGDTGSARGTGCHLHFGLSVPCGPGDWERRRGEIWPQRYLDEWKAGRQLSAVAEASTRSC